MFKVLKLKVQTAGLVFVVNKPQQEKKTKNTEMTLYIM